MRYKSWPFYPDWCEIFGKERVVKEDAAHFADAVQELETNKGKDKEAGAEFGCVFEGHEDDEHEMSVCQPQSDETAKKQAPKKRKISDCSSDPFVAAIDAFCDKLETRFEEIARRRIGFEYDVSNARRELYGALGRVPGLEVRDKLNVAKFLVNKTGDLDLFFSFPEEGRVKMVNMILTVQY